MDLASALAAARDRNQSVLTTLKRDGKPQLSNVLHAVDEEGVIRISTTADRAKYANLRRTPWAALHVDGKDFWSYAVIEGDVELSEVAADPHDAATDELVASTGGLRVSTRTGTTTGPPWCGTGASSCGSGRPTPTARCARWVSPRGCKRAPLSACAGKAEEGAVGATATDENAASVRDEGAACSPWT